jgi:hypothetical protein
LTPGAWINEFVRTQLTAAAARIDQTGGLEYRKTRQFVDRWMVDRYSQYVNRAYTRHRIDISRAGAPRVTALTVLEARLVSNVHGERSTSIIRRRGDVCRGTYLFNSRRLDYLSVIPRAEARTSRSKLSVVAGQWLGTHENASGEIRGVRYRV